MQAAKGPLQQQEAPEGKFSVFGIDILLQGDGTLHLLEFTAGPGMRMQPEWLGEMHQELIEEQINILEEVEVQLASRTCSSEEGEAALTIEAAKLWEPICCC